MNSFFIAVQCPDPQVLNGLVVAANCSKQRQSTCEYKCDEGFSKKDAIPMLTCGTDGSWKENMTSVCEGMHLFCCCGCFCVCVFVMIEFTFQSDKCTHYTCISQVSAYLYI